jgi:transcriptional regulator with XRE-family HTH domain
VPGLRREEAAMLVGLSVDYYVQLERGSLKGVSDGLLNALANALQFDDAERTHLFDLASAANASGNGPRRPSPQKVRPGLQRVLEAIIMTSALRRY